MTNSFDNEMTNQTVIILASARSDGNTAKMANLIGNHLKADIIDLRSYQIGHYDYEHNYREDDFIELFRNKIIKAETIIFATPVYWYSMSGRMKVFLDRMTDLLKIEKDLGRQLRGKNLAVFTTSNGGNLENDFWRPFVETADYLGMNYLANTHFLEKDITAADSELDFVNNLLTARTSL